MQRRRRRAAEVQLSVCIVFDDRYPMPTREREELASKLDRHRPTGGVLESRVRVNELRTIPDEQIFELIEIVAYDIPADQLRSGSSKRVNRAQISRAVDDHRILGIDEA